MLDACAPWYGLPRTRQEEIRSPGAWLTTATSRICPDLLGSARVVNGAPGLVAVRAGVVMTVASFDVADERVTRIWAVRNPAALRPWAGRPVP